MQDTCLPSRLTELNQGNVWRTYQYSHSGEIIGADLHLTEPNGPAAPQASYSYQSGTNQVSSLVQSRQSAINVAYDARGNTTAYGNQMFSYDTLGRMVSAKLGGSQVGAYTYNFLNQGTYSGGLAGTALGLVGGQIYDDLLNPPEQPRSPHATPCPN